MSFRAKAGEMIKSTFLSENVTLQLAQQKDKPAGEYNVNFTLPGQPGQMLNSISRNADVYLKKEDKIFGAGTLKIWGVQLGEVK